jgi:hypothetical protein
MRLEEKRRKRREENRTEQKRRYFNILDAGANVRKTKIVVLKTRKGERRKKSVLYRGK